MLSIISINCQIIVFINQIPTANLSVNSSYSFEGISLGVTTMYWNFFCLFLQIRFKLKIKILKSLRLFSIHILAENL